MSTLVDRVVPARLGDAVRRLLPAAWSTQLGDGVALAAGPLAVASLTHAPLPVALSVGLQRVPVLLVGPYAAALADLVHRRTLVVAGNVLRIVVLLVLALTLATGNASVGGVLTALLVLGLLETLVDAASGPLAAMLLPEADDRALAADRLDAGFLLGTQLLGPPLGAFLFSRGAGSAYAAQAALLGLAALLVSRLAVPGPARGAAHRRRSRRRPVRTGLRRVAVDPALSALTIAGMASQAAWAAAWSVLVLLASARLGMGATGFGLLISAGAVGGLVGVLAQDRILGRLRPVVLLRAGLGVEAVGYAVLAATGRPGLAVGLVTALGAVSVVWSSGLRAQREARVGGVATEPVAAAVTALALAATVGGCVVGGVLAALGGVGAAYWGASAVSLAALGLLWRRLAAL